MRRDSRRAIADALAALERALAKKVRTQNALLTERFASDRLGHDTSGGRGGGGGNSGRR